MRNDESMDKPRRSSCLFWLILAVLTPLFLFCLFLKAIRMEEDSRMPSKTSVCAGNLRQIGLAICNYRQAHAGNVPPTFDILVNETQLAPECLRCPESQEEYIYRGGDLGKFDKPGFIVAYDREPVHKGGRNIMDNYASGYFLKEKNFQERIADENEIRKRFNLKSRPAE